ncbi:MAG: hypothetical protein AAB473_01070 [Patescibacteria group bacterium]
MVEHEALKAKLRKEFDRLEIRDEDTRDNITAEVNRFAKLFIEVYGQ